MKILVTGGNGKLATKLKMNDSYSFLTPGKDELDLLNPHSIKVYYEKNKDIDGIILNAFLPAHNPYSTIPSNNWTNYDCLNENAILSWKYLFQLNSIATMQLMYLYNLNLKFVIGLITGKIEYKDNINSFPYVFQKEILANTLDRISYDECFSNTKIFKINPGPMRNDEEYENHSNIICNYVLTNIDNAENRKSYSLNDFSIMSLDTKKIL